MILEESYNSILDKIELIAKTDSSICKFLALACISIKDDQAAEHLLRRLRKHVALTLDEESMYDVTYYLAYVEDILDLTEDFESANPIKPLRNRIKDVYEQLLYNKLSLMAALNDLERQSLIAGLRENYWVN